MNQLLLDPSQRQAVSGITSLAAVLLAASALFGQTNTTGHHEWDQRPPAHLFADWNELSIASTEAHPAHHGENTVTLQALRHKVSKKGRKEAEKAKRALAENRTDEAIGHLKCAISIDPELVASRNSLAAIYLRAANPEPAIAQLEEAAKIDPKQPVLYMNLAVGYAMIHNLEAAERAARWSVDLDRTGGGHARMVLAFALIAQRKFTEEALQCFAQVRDKYPVAHLLAAHVLLAQGHSERAKSEIYTYLSSGERTFREAAARLLDRVSQSQ
jgi:tetratricopeptide (TPR) repeat protein